MQRLLPFPIAPIAPPAPRFRRADPTAAWPPVKPAECEASLLRSKAAARTWGLCPQSRIQYPRPGRWWTGCRRVPQARVRQEKPPAPSLACRSPIRGSQVELLADGAVLVIDLQ